MNRIKFIFLNEIWFIFRSSVVFLWLIGLYFITRLSNYTWTWWKMNKNLNIKSKYDSWFFADVDCYFCLF